MSRPVITLTTDFGMGSPYVAQMKGVILSINPEIVIVDISHQVAPDNGVLSRVVRRSSPRRVLALTNRELWLRPVSNTFHGRDIMAPVAAHFVSGAAPESFGTPVDQLQSLEWPEPQVRAREIRGCVLYADSFGNLITNIGRDLVENLGKAEDLCVQCAGYAICGTVRTYGQAEAGSLVALIGSSGQLEIAVVQGNAAQYLNVDCDQEVILSRNDVPHLSL